MEQGYGGQNFLDLLDWSGGTLLFLSMKEEGESA